MLSNAFHKILRKPVHLLLTIIAINVVCVLMMSSIIQYKFDSGDSNLIESSQITNLIVKSSRLQGKKMVELTCLTVDLNDKTNKMNTHQTGGFCLPVGDPKKLASHYPFDTKLATNIATKCFDDGKANVTVTDLGAGPGHYGKFWLFRSEVVGYRGLDAAGNVETISNGLVDWTDLTEPLNHQWNLVSNQPISDRANYFWTGSNLRPKDETQAYLHTTDWVVSLEVLEHVPGHRESIVVDNILKLTQNGIILSWAIPRQGGVSHINEKPNEYVLDLFVNKLGFKYCKTTSDHLRSTAQLPWFKNTIFVFTKREEYKGFKCK